MSTSIVNHRQRRIIMSELDVKIVELSPMRMLSSYGFGPEPESIAWEKLRSFMKKHKMETGGKFPSTYGFNNPDPCNGSPNYGYEIWLPVEKELEPEGDLRIIHFYGGLYAVTRFKDLNNIGKVWGELVKWQESSKYKRGAHQWLEHLLEGHDQPIEESVFDLYLPIAE
jgi:effector-binding domain-containing protein